MRYGLIEGLWSIFRRREINYPKNCIKGISKNDDVGKDGHVGSHVFYFDAKHARNDGWIEQSINWEDDNFARTLTLKQKKEDGRLQFRGGIAILPRLAIDRLGRLPMINGLISYERRPFGHNQYHGNLLLKANVEKPTMRRIAAGLALHVSEVISQSNMTPP